jgi:hypothetical protein
MYITRCSQRVSRAEGLANHLTSEASADTIRADCEPNDFSSGLFQRLNNTATEEDGDIANSRCAPGLSNLSYMIQMVKNKNKQDDQFHPNIVHCGRSGTLRHSLFYSRNISFVGFDGRPAGTKNQRGLKAYNLKFLTLFRAFEPIFRINPHLKIPIFTELRKDNVLYRADPCSPHALEDTQKHMTQSWCDWALFKYKGSRNKVCLYPGHIAGFTSFDTVAVKDAFNKMCDSRDKLDTCAGVAGFAIAELTSRELVGFSDPASQPIPDQQMQANSSLFFWEKKETITETVTDSVMVNISNNSSRGKLSSGNTRSKKRPIIVSEQHRVRVVSISLISDPIVAFEDFAPTFDHTNNVTTCGTWVPSSRVGAFIFVRPRAQWGQVFLARARQALAHHKKETSNTNISNENPDTTEVTTNEQVKSGAPTKKLPKKKKIGKKRKSPAQSQTKTAKKSRKNTK